MEKMKNHENRIIKIEDYLKNEKPHLIERKTQKNSSMKTSFF